MNREQFVNDLQSIDNQKNPIISLLDIYSNYSNDFNAEYFKYIVACAYLDYKELYPNLDIFILWRIKSQNSFEKNIQKTFSRSLDLQDPSKQYFYDSSSKDILGMKLVINSVPDILNFDRRNPKYSKVFELYKQKLDNLNFIEKLNDWLYGDSEEFQSEESFYKYYIELLDRLEKSKYEQCTDEVETPYFERRDKAILKSNLLKKDSNFSLEISDSQVEDLKKLIKCLERRLDDKLQNEILNVTFHEVLNDGPRLKKLNVHSQKDPSPSKIDGWLYTLDGYVAMYEKVYTDSGLTIEAQGQSKKGHEDDKSGVSFHNGMPGKKIPLDIFFELKDPNDAKPLEVYLTILKSIPASSLEKSDAQYTNSFRKKAQFALEHVKLKDEIIFNNQGSNTIISLTMKEYLKRFKDYYAPQLGTTNSGHNSIKPTVNIVKKSDSQELEDILRDKDGLSVLAKIIIDKYEDFYPSINSFDPIDDEKINEFIETNFKTYMEKENIEK